MPVIAGKNSTERLNGTAASDTIRGLGGSDRIRGLSGLAPNPSLSNADSMVI